MGFVIIIIIERMLSRLNKSIKFFVVNESKIINPYTHEAIPPRSYITDDELFNRVT